MSFIWGCWKERETWGNLTQHMRFLSVPNTVRDLKSILLDMYVFLCVLNRVWDQQLVLMTGKCGASFSSNTETNYFVRASLISPDVGQTKTLKKGFYVTWNTLMLKLFLFQTKLSFLYPNKNRSKSSALFIVWPKTRATITLFSVISDYFSKCCW